MSSSFGLCLRITVFGQSHGPCVGMVLDGFPAGMKLDLARLEANMKRRRPGRDGTTTARQEADEPVFLSGIFQGKTSGQPVCVIIGSNGQRPEDYGEAMDVLRPGHADYTGHIRYHGFEDYRGGGSFSGRLTAPLVVAGSMCDQYLESKGIQIEAHIASVGTVRDTAFEEIPEEEDLSFLKDMELPLVRRELVPQVRSVIEQAAEEGDSVGGIGEVRIKGLPPGLGSPFFDSAESLFSHMLFSIPGVKGVSFGSGFELSGMRGSEANDPWKLEKEKIRTATNHAGGINGGITNGMPLIFQCAFRPTPSISRKQNSVSMRTMSETELILQGRHDPCILSRAIPVLESAAAFCTLDLLLERKTCL